MEDETSGKESTLILGRPFLMTARTKIDVHVGMLSMEFGDTLVQFNIFEAMKHPTEDHSLFGIDLLDEIVEEYLQLNSSSEDIEKLIGSTDEISYLGVADEEADYEEIQDLPNSKDNHSDIADLGFEVELSKLINQVYNLENPESATNTEVRVAETEESPIGNIKVNSAEKSNSTTDTLAETVSANEDQIQAGVKIIVPSGSDSKTAQEVNTDSNPTRIEATESSRPKQQKAEIMSAHLMPSRIQVGQTDPSPVTEKSPLSPPPMELKPFPSHLKYTYLDKE
ncbi:hypothetical protein CR513_57505, partial [Mucuna pruriens]